MKYWPHAPLHLFNEKGTYFVTGSTLYRKLHFTSNTAIELLHDTLLDLAEHYNWKLEAWAVFANHYHFIAKSPNDPKTLKKFVTHLHSTTARELNVLDNLSGRKVWYEYRDTKISFHPSYLARLNYVIQNPVRHKLVTEAADYPWCSARWFEKNTSKAYFKTVTSFKTDTVNIEDDFDY